MRPRAFGSVTVARPEFLNDLRRFRASRRPLVAIGFLAALVAQLEAVALVLLVPWASTIAEDETTYRGKLGPFSLSVDVWTLAVIIVGLVLLALALSVAQLWLRARTVARWQKAARANLLQRWLAASWERQSTDRVGALATVMEFVQRGGLVLLRVTELIRSSLTLLVFLITAVLISPLVAGLLTLAGVVLSRALRPVVGLSRSSSQRLIGLTRKYNDELTEVATLGRDIKVFDATEAFTRRLDGMSDEIERARTRQTLIGGLTQPLYQYVGLLLSVIAIAFIAQRGSSSVESIGSTALLLLRGLTYALGAQTAYQIITETSPFLDSAEQFAASLADAADVEGGAPIGDIDELRLNDVSYRFTDSTDDALNGVDVTLRRGEAIGIVGVSGSGKTTLAQLILRLRQPTSGAIHLNGTPASELSLTSWRRRVGFVPQDVRLLHTSVLDNITFLDDSIPRSAVEDALIAVGLAAEIEALPQGLDTQIGSAVRNLSGGQIQRIGIARALVRNPGILVLDEPTSALDTRSEAIVHDTVATLRERMIVVIIAHRLSTLEHCDQLVVMRDGTVEMQGPANVVRATSPYFREVVSPTLQPK